MKRNRTEYMREYKRQQRAEARKAGSCIVCIAGKPRKGNATCDECQQRANDAKRTV